MSPSTDSTDSTQRTDSTTCPSTDESFLTKGLGWLPDLPDLRDYTVATPQVSELLAGTSVATSTQAGSGASGTSTRRGARQAGAAAAPTLPTRVDLRAKCSPIEDQGHLGSCTANAAVGVLEYFAQAAFERHEDLSRLFVYKVTRETMGWTGDTGAFLRSAMGAIATFGAPPEKYWPYDITQFEAEPSAFAYAFAQSFKAATYYRLDPPGTAAADTLAAVKEHLSSGLPSMFGFAVYSSYSTSGKTGRFPYPSPGEKQVGGHAVVTVGYDDALEVTHPTTGATTVGALLIRNSWGTGWGEAGYGWLPYEYVLRGMAEDFWVVLKAEWINTGQFAQ